jgi:hypothetical protein
MLHVRAKDGACSTTQPFKDENPMIQSGCRHRFRLLEAAFSEGDVALVECLDPRGREVDVLCLVIESFHDDAYYMPLGFMISETNRKLFKTLSPPPSLRGEMGFLDGS